MRTKFAIALAVAVVCVTTAWAGWDPEARITGDNSTARSFCLNYGHSVVFGPDGVGHLVWDSPGVGCNRYNQPGGWTPDYQISQSGGDPCVALDADGTTIHVMWDDADVCYRKCTRGVDGNDEWGPVVHVSAHADWPVMASVPNDPSHLVACWARGFTLPRNKSSSAIAFVECVNGVWSTELRLDSAASVSRHFPTIAVAPNGDVFIAYIATDDNPSGRQVYVKTRHDGAWQTTVDVTPGLSPNWIAGAAVEADPYTGNPHVVFSCRIVKKISKKVSDTTWAVYHTYRNSQGVWQTPELVSVPQHLGYDLAFSHGATMAFANDGTANAVWSERYPATSHGVKYSYCPAEGGTWSSPGWLTSDTSASYQDRSPFVAVDEYGSAVRVVWCRVYSGLHIEVWGRNGTLSGGGGMGRLAALPQSGIELFPNPARAGRVTVQYALPHAGQAIVTLLDVSGRAVRTQEVAAGIRGTFAIDLRALNAGVYVMKLDAGATSLTRKVVLTE
jgi:hypothetical protein